MIVKTRSKRRFVFCGLRLGTSQNGGGFRKCDRGILFGVRVKGFVVFWGIS